MRQGNDKRISMATKEFDYTQYVLIKLNVEAHKKL